MYKWLKKTWWGRGIWHRRYKVRLIEVAGLTDKQAQEYLDAGMREHDYDEDPKDSADTEMSYWDDDRELI